MPTVNRFPTAINIVNIKKRKKSGKYANELNMGDSPVYMLDLLFVSIQR